jgi:hypothetical protein
MKIYRLEAAFNTGGDMVGLYDKDGSLFDTDGGLLENHFKERKFSGFFCWNTGDGSFLKHRVPLLTANKRIKLKKVETADYLPLIVNIPIFSEKAKNLFSDIFPNEADYHECCVDCEGTRLKFYLCRILKFIPLINREKSTFRHLTDGTPMVHFPVYHEKFADNFYIARDEEHTSYLGVSQLFVDRCKSEKLKIDFSERDQA